MKRVWIATLLCLLLGGALGGTALATDGGTLRVGLRYGSSAMPTANLENEGGYAFGYYDGSFVPLGETAQKTISMTGDSRYHVRLPDVFADFGTAAAAAAQYPDGFPAYSGGGFMVYLGSFGSGGEAESAAAQYGGTVVSPGGTGIAVTVTKTSTILFQFDGLGAQDLVLQPVAEATWFQGNQYRGSFTYRRGADGNLQVVNLVGLEDYVKGVVPNEMPATWAEEALKAQAVCARTFAKRCTKHQKYGFDVCGSTDCQVYSGLKNATANSDAAVDATAGQCLYADGALIEAVFFSSDGGATEDAANVWGSDVSYLKGKADPYEANVTIPNYSYSVTYSGAELMEILQTKKYDIGRVTRVFVSGRSQTGNVTEVTFADSGGKTVKVTGEACRTVFYSSTYQKSVRSMRFDVLGGGGGYPLAGGGTLFTLTGSPAISGTGTVSPLPETPYVITPGGTVPAEPAPTVTGDSFTIVGTGSGHNVGMSQYGARAMAEAGQSYTDILNFYYTGVTLG
ncbi:MAG: SpoIID/LytB domain-containing protein [Oscillospiraceae bacterium]